MRTIVESISVSYFLHITILNVTNFLYLANMFTPKYSIRKARWNHRKNSYFCNNMAPTFFKKWGQMLCFENGVFIALKKKSYMIMTRVSLFRESVLRR